MDIKQLRALVAVADTGSVTRAAEILHIVQPAVSRQLRLLEDDIGVALFERNRYGMTATDAGDTLVAYARRALAELDRGRAEIQPASNIAGPVTLGLLTSTVHLAAQFVTEVGLRFPDVRLRILSGYSDHLRQWLETGEADVALLYDSRTLPALELRPLLDERLWLVGPPGAGYRIDRSVALTSLAGQRLILPNAPHGLRTMVEQGCAALRVRLDVAAETNSVDVQKQLVLAGVGLTILPASAVADEVERGAMSAAPFADSAMQRRIALATSRTRKVPAVVSRVAAILVEQMRMAVNDGKWPTATWIAPP